MDRLFCFFAITECRVHDASLHQVCSQATVSCWQPEYSGLLMSCPTVDWVCRGIVVSSGSSPLTFWAVSEQGFGFLESDSGQVLQLFAPRLGQVICSFISWNPTVVWDPLGLWCILVGEAAGLSAVGGLAGERYQRLGTDSLKGCFRVCEDDSLLWFHPYYVGYCILECWGFCFEIGAFSVCSICVAV